MHIEMFSDESYLVVKTVWYVCYDCYETKMNTCYKKIKCAFDGRPKYLYFKTYAHYSSCPYGRISPLIQIHLIWLIE